MEDSQVECVVCTADVNVLSRCGCVDFSSATLGSLQRVDGEQRHRGVDLEKGAACLQLQF